MTVDPLDLMVARRGERALETLAALRAQDPPTTGGRVLSYVYDSGLEGLDERAVRAAGLTHGRNGLDPPVFSSVARVHCDVLARVRSNLGRDASAGANVPASGRAPTADG